MINRLICLISLTRIDEKVMFNFVYSPRTDRFIINPETIKN